MESEEVSVGGHDRLGWRLKIGSETAVLTAVGSSSHSLFGIRSVQLH